jgi:transcriptional regulator GlxA family with amidase domain
MKERAMDVAILIFDGVTALDAVGPYQVLSLVPGARVRWVAAEPGPKRCDGGMVLVAMEPLDAVPHPEVIVVPGGLDVRPAMADPRVRAWLTAAHATARWTTSVCSGALILAASGLLAGRRATTHWAVMEQLGKLGARPVAERVVEEGRVITAAGVSAGIDMALTLAARLAGPVTAQAVQLAIEYSPEPPFSSGSLATSPPEVVSAAGTLLLEAIRDEAARRPAA